MSGIRNYGLKQQEAADAYVRAQWLSASTEGDLDFAWRRWNMGSDVDLVLYHRWAMLNRFGGAYALGECEELVGSAKACLQYSLGRAAPPDIYASLLADDLALGIVLEQQPFVRQTAGAVLRAADNPDYINGYCYTGRALAHLFELNLASATAEMNTLLQHCENKALDKAEARYFHAWAECALALVRHDQSGLASAAAEVRTAWVTQLDRELAKWHRGHPGPNLALWQFADLQTMALASLAHSLGMGLYPTGSVDGAFADFVWVRACWTPGSAASLQSANQEP